MLTALKKMLSDELSDNLYDVLLYALLQTFVPIIGGIANLYFYSKRHGMACGELVVAWLLGGFFSGVLGWITSYMLGGFVRAMF